MSRPRPVETGPKMSIPRLYRDSRSSLIWLHFMCSILLYLLSLIVALWHQENCQTLLDLEYLLCLPFLQLCFMSTEPILLNLPTLASIAPYMAFPCFHEVCLHLLVLLGFAKFNIWTLILIGLEYICNMVKAAQGNKIQKLFMDWRTDWRTDGRTEWVTLSLLELLVAAKDTKRIHSTINFCYRRNKLR